MCVHSQRGALPHSPPKSDPSLEPPSTPPHRFLHPPPPLLSLTHPHPLFDSAHPITHTMGAADGNKRRVSYVIPAPDTASPVLELPPFGTGAEATRSYPLLTPKRTNGRTSTTTTQFASRNPFAPPPPLPLKAAARSHPRHRLGITSLALDTSTVLSGNSAPGGILYTGGRDGLVAAWDLNISQQKRRGRRYRPVAGRGTGQRVRWERIGDGGDWDDDDDDAAGEADETSSDDDDVGAPLESNGSGGRKKLAYEDRWEVDREAIARQVSARDEARCCGCPQPGRRGHTPPHTCSRRRSHLPRQPSASRSRHTPTGSTPWCCAT